jgi:hypothetical protein
MDTGTIRLAIRRKLESGRLPLEGTSKIWGLPAVEQTCDGCDTIIARNQLVIDGVARMPRRKGIQLHLRCFEIWAQERCSLLKARDSIKTGLPAYDEAGHLE